MFERLITFRSDPRSLRAREADRTRASKIWYALLFLVPVLYGVVISLWAEHNFRGGLGPVVAEGGPDPQEAFEGIRRYILLLPLTGIFFLPMVWRGIGVGVRMQFIRLYAIYAAVLLLAFMVWLYLIIAMRPTF